MIYWKNGFYDRPINGGVEISEQEWRDLLNGQSAGKQIITDTSGRPALIDPMLEISAIPYELQVEALIRKRYTVSDELAILRQRDTKPEEFKEYNAFCEECKSQAKPKQEKI